MPSEKTMTPILDIISRMNEMKRLYVLVEVKKNSQTPEWIEKLKVAISAFDNMTWFGNDSVHQEDILKEKQFLVFLNYILLCQAYFILPSYPCEHLQLISQHLNVICMHGRNLQNTIDQHVLIRYIDSKFEDLARRTQQPNWSTGPRGLLNSHYSARNEIGNLLSRL